MTPPRLAPSPIHSYTENSPEENLGTCQRENCEIRARDSGVLGSSNEPQLSYIGQATYDEKPPESPARYQSRSGSEKRPVMGLSLRLDQTTNRRFSVPNGVFG
jgi:hypothetical protein